MNIQRLAACLVFGSTVLFTVGVASAQGPFGGGVPAAPADPHDISGSWYLTFDARRVPPAQLAAGVTKAKRDAVAKVNAHAIRYCNLLGIQAVMDSGRPIDIQQGKTQIVIIPPVNSTPRYLYFRAEHVPSDVFDPSSVGDSIARWDGDSLIVDTTGFRDDMNVVEIPGGGFLTPSMHLVERYRLIDANTLAVTFTWIDPKVYRTPHTYEFRYSRTTPSDQPENWPTCDPYSQVRTNFLEGPLTPANQPLPAVPAAAAPTQGGAAGRAGGAAPAGRGAAPAAGGRQGGGR